MTMLTGSRIDECEAATLEAQLPHCPYCKAGMDRHAMTGGKTFIHVLTRDAQRVIAKSRPCTRA